MASLRFGRTAPPGQWELSASGTRFRSGGKLHEEIHRRLEVGLVVDVRQRLEPRPPQPRHNLGGVDREAPAVISGPIEQFRGLGQCVPVKYLVRMAVAEGFDPVSEGLDQLCLVHRAHLRISGVLSVLGIEPGTLRDSAGVR